MMMLSKSERFIKKHLDRSEQDLLIKYDRWLKMVFQNIPIHANEMQIHQYHLPQPALLSTILTKHSLEMYDYGYAHGDAESKELQRKFKIKLADYPGFDGNDDLDEDQAKDVLRKRSKAIASEVEIDLVSGIKKALMLMHTGAALPVTQEAIRNLWDHNKNRASLITTTETTYAYNRGRLASYREAKVDYVRFSAIMDARTSQICSSRHGLVMAMDDSELGANTPPLHGRCRSVLTPIYSRYEPGLITPRNTDWSHVDPLPKGWVTGQHNAENASGTVGEVKKGPVWKYNNKATFRADLPKVSYDVAGKLAKINRNLAKQGAKNFKETVVLVDKTTGKSLADHTGKIDFVDFDGKLDQALLRASPNSVILTHNHPRGTRVNILDMLNFTRYQSLSHIVAVNHDGTISYITNNGQYVTEREMEKIFKRNYDAVTAELRKSKTYGKLSKTAQSEYLEDAVLRRMVDELGWTYGEKIEPTGKARNYR